MMARGRSLGVRNRFVLIVLFGVVAPIAVVGVWIARTTHASGEALLRARLDQSLADAARTIGYRWVDERSTLLTLAENAAVVAALRPGGDLTTSRDRPALDALQRAWTQLDGRIDAVVLRDTAGVARGTLDRGSGTPRAGVEPTLRVRIPVYEPRSATPLGALDVGVRLTALLPTGFWWGGVGGSVPAIFEPEGNKSLLAVPMSGELFDHDGFDWSGDAWLVARRTLDEPGMRLALAAPIGPFMLPFAAAARQGSVALLLALLATVILASALTSRITDPLERLAAASDAVARGELDHQVAERGPDEIRRLATAFNSMTESLRRTLQLLSQREALAAVGEFAASLAHEVRNPLTAMRLDLERAREKTGDPARVNELMGEALRQIDRLDATVSASLRMARSGQLDLTPVDLRQPLKAAMHTARPAFDAAGASLAPWAAPTEPLVVRGNGAALEQLFLNLLLNAAEALDAGGEAALSVERTAGGTCVVISDNGHGIPKESLERVFEPFFSTKERGTGLGLPLAQRIVQAHGGMLAVASDVGTGTVVRVTLRRDASPLRESADQR